LFVMRQHPPIQTEGEWLGNRFQLLPEAYGLAALVSSAMSSSETDEFFRTCAA
jgi:hypothetical protein